MIPNAETLRKIQVEHGVTGSFKDRPLADWLQKHNPGEDEYEKVRKSLAGSLLLVPHSAGMRPPHVPFSTVGSFPPFPGCGKLHLLLRWLLRGHLRAGDLRPAQRQHHAQDHGAHVPHRLRQVPGPRADVRQHQEVRSAPRVSIPPAWALQPPLFVTPAWASLSVPPRHRDRAPFVFTSDMAYVINGGDKPSSRFHDFVDLCCQAYNLIRKHTHLFLNLLGLVRAGALHPFPPRTVEGSSCHRPPSSLPCLPDAVLWHPRALRPGGPQVRLRCPEATGL